MDAEKIEQKLLDREYKLMYYLPENVGHVSPWYIGPMGHPDGSDRQDYWEWRANRRKFAATGDAKYLKAMTEFVSDDNPPLASDFGSDIRKWTFKDVICICLVCIAIVAVIFGLEFV